MKQQFLDYLHSPENERAKSSAVEAILSGTDEELHDLLIARHKEKHS